ncbi:MAG TPA: methyltransferase domain-containing protein [Nostocaceae cyanobacterium]|nr:methyltransferase domain-containing protein [Nostocaceae cyanobacterium]
MQRILEPEVMDTLEEAVAYDAMDFAAINQDFAQKAVSLCPKQNALILDMGTGTARIPIFICEMRPQWQIIATDLAQNMLKIATQNLQQFNLQQQIQLQVADAKNLPYENEQFDLVISNSLVHHLPEPLLFFQELKRVIKPHGGILIRDLFRPANTEIVDNLVENIGTEYDETQKKLFHDSLCAALTLDEVNQLIDQVGLTDVQVYQSSERHWTVERQCTNM